MPQSKLDAATKLLNGDGSLDVTLVDEVRSSVLSPSPISEDYYTVCAAFIEASKVDEGAIQAILSNVRNTLISPDDEGIFFSAQILTKLQARWNCFSKLLDISLEALTLSDNEKYHELVYPASVVVGLCANRDPAGKLHKEIFFYGKKFMEAGDNELAEHFARALCLEKMGNKADCFRTSYDVHKIFV